MADRVTELFKGTVKSYDRNEYIGTITPEDDFSPEGTEEYDHLTEGQKVEVTFVRVPKKLKAAKVVVI